MKFLKQTLVLTAFLVWVPALLLAKVTGNISGTVRDAQGAVVPAATVSALDVQTGVVQKTETDSVGFYNFPALPIGTYNVSVEKAGFKAYRETGLIIDVDTSLRVDAVLQVGAEVQTVTVTAAAAQVNTETMQNGEVIEATEMTDLPLNGRAFTDLLALQPGVVPINVALFGTLAPANYLDDGVLSMSGQRDVQNGYMVNGANIVEGDMGGTTVIPNLDSIAEFRIITSNAGAEYGNYSGGQVNVITKSGTNQYHGDVFEFLRNSDMDARNFFSATRGVLHQNMFGATFGGPILKNKLFFFADYQGTRILTGVDTGNILVPSAADRTGNVSDLAATIAANTSANAVQGAYFAGVLSARLGYPVTAGEAYFGSTCTATTQCVFPNYVVPQAAWDTPSAKAIGLIPLPNVPGTDYFSTSANPSTLQDDKSGLRIDANSKIGMISGYWHYNPWNNLVPYNAGFGGSNVPGFPGLVEGKAQVFTFGVTTNFGGNKVNQFTASYFRNKNIQGISPSSGPSLSSLGFAAPGAGGLYQEASGEYQNWPSISLNNYHLGPSNSVLAYYDQTSQLQDDFSVIKGNHTIKVGADYHWDQFWVAHPDNGGDGGFGFNGYETGLDFSDLLVGAPDYFYQGAAAALSERSFYIGIYGEDTWRITHNLTLSYGLRWEVTPYWADSHDRNPQLILGDQSTTFPTAPTGYVFPGDPGVPYHMANIRYDNFGPRLGLAYAPNFSTGILHKIFGDSGQSSIRAGFGSYYTNIEGAATFNFSSAPYGLFDYDTNYPGFSAPFINRLDGVLSPQPFPLPPVQKGDTNINWAIYEPIGGKIDPLVNDPSPYAEHLDFSIQRQLQQNTLLTVSYVGTFGHHLLLNTQNNPANPALCLALSTPASVMPNTPTCGPGGETGLFYPATGGTTTVRGPFNQDFGDNGYYLDAGNSDYHALEVSLRKTSARQQFLISYTYSKSMDNGSAFGDQVIANGNPHQFEALSVFDLPNNFSASYTVELPFDKLFRSNNRAIRGWKISGITTFSDGTPVQISEVDDHSLLGSTGNSPQYGSTDEPFRLPGAIYQDRNPRVQYYGPNGLVNTYFNTNLFVQEGIGQQGNSSRRFFFGPGLNNWTLALLKDVKLTERMKLEFRAEWFNAFNHTQFGMPDGGIIDGPYSFGGITSAGGARVGQIAGKFIF